MFVEITFDNGYTECEVEEYMEVEDEEDAQCYAEDSLTDYAESYFYVATSWGNDFETEEEREEYFENCSYSIKEITQEEYEDNMWGGEEYGGL